MAIAMQMMHRDALADRHAVLAIVLHHAQMHAQQEQGNVQGIRIRYVLTQMVMVALNGEH